jgi:hypothetical protein
MLRTRAKKANLEWRGLSKASGIVVFGSRAAGLHNQSSDLDVLVIDVNDKRMKRAGLDLIYITVATWKSGDWLRSELAGHILHYGVWIQGDAGWPDYAWSGEWAAMLKQRRLISLVQNVSVSWNRLHPIFQDKYRTMVRRELQRLDLLRKSIPIPPTFVLDAEWRSSKVTLSEVTSLAKMTACLTSSEQTLVQKCDLLSLYDS